MRCGVHLHADTGDTAKVWQREETTALVLGGVGGGSTVFFDSPAEMVRWLDDARAKAVALVQTAAR